MKRIIDKMKLLLNVLVLGIFLLSSPLYAQDVSSNPTNELQRQMQELQEQMQLLTQNGSFSPMGNKAQPSQRDNNLQRSVGVVIRFMVSDGAQVMDDLDELCSLNTKHCEFLSQYWRVAALKSCVEFNNYTLQNMSSFEELSPEQESFFMSSIEQCNINYYYDHWDKVKETITESLLIAQKQSNSNATKE